jgi:hypothetical protein
MRYPILLQLILLTWLGTSTTANSQQPPELRALYGRGVHSYFGNQVSLAEQQFSKVIDAGSTDPRVYYFRGIARLRMGRQHEARSDMRIGADYEARRPGDRGAISKSLQRVQGQGRLMLERFRREARLMRGEKRRTQSRIRYQRLRGREVDVLRHPVDLPLEQLIGAPTGAETPATSPELGMGTSSPQETTPVDAQLGPATTVPEISPADIPAGQSLPADMSDTSDPFGDATPSTPDLEEPESAVPPPQPEMPVSPEPATGEDPFGEQVQSAGPASEKRPPAAPKGEKATADSSKQTAGQKTVGAKGKAPLESKSTGKKSAASTASAPDESAKSSSVPDTDDADTSDSEDDPFGAEDDPFGEF